MNKFKLDNMGVLVIMSHLLITIALIAVYTYTLVAGVQDETLKTVLTVIVGYWFGAVGKEAIIKKEDNRHAEQRTEHEKDKSVS